MVELAGRGGSLRLLADAAAAAREGRGGLVMVRADPGLGVTAVLDAHLAAMRDAGLRTHRIPVLPPSGRTALSVGRPPDWSGPAVVVIDDLHRVDDATLLALHGIADELTGRALLIVTGRHRGASPERFARLDRDAVVHDLPPLDDDAAHAVLAASIGGDPPEALRQLAAGAGGNPWLLTRLADEHRTTAVATWATELAGGDAALLRFAAVLDEPTSVDELADVAGAAPVDVLAGVGRLAALGLVVAEAGQVRLRHPLVRQDVATNSAGLRAPVARALATRGAAPEAVAGQLARTPVDAWTAAWLDEHADGLALRPTPHVVELLHRAVSRLPQGNSRLHPLRAALAEALLWSGHADDARLTATTSLAARPDPATRQRLRAVLALAAICEMDGAAASAALDPERRDGELPARLAAVDAYARLLAADLEGASWAIAQAAPAAAHDPLVEVYLLNVQAVGRCLTRDLTGALELLDRVDALLDVAVHDRGQWLMSRLMRAVVQDLRHDPAVFDTVAEARPMARLIGRGLLAWLHTIAALASFNDGRWERAMDEISAAVAMDDQYGLGGPLHGLASWILLHRGDIPGARLHDELAGQAPGRGVAMFYEQITVVCSAQVADAVGDQERALALVRSVSDGVVGVHHGHAVAGVCAALVRVAVRAGDRELAATLVEQLKPWNSGASNAERGTLAYCQGLLDGDADALLAIAGEFAGTVSPMFAARATEDAAMVLAASGRSARARTTYQAAIDAYRALSATHAIRRAEAEMRSFGLRRGSTEPRRRPKHGWDALTAAEYRVVELVAQGLTNREVAERLVVSVRTVDSHVSRALAKLGYSSRVEIALKFEHRE
ncbi:LuxR C-terminal-related transcriptional regulator [Saccharopolyspora cebuensis]|uniref:LuxR C-terminal-related transcriptional regulator n=1 Tax=Saccharopolyspora cebuensis TaxID=418759 RepID=A0ABV4CJN7_9PSEU